MKLIRRGDYTQYDANMTISTRISASTVLLAAWLFASFAHAEDKLSRVIHAMDRLDELQLTGKAVIAAEGPRNSQVLRVEDPVEMRIDLAADLNPRNFDLVKIEVKADRGAFVRVSLENFPLPGQLAHWYVLDTARGPFDWKTIWIDLNRPEEIKEAGTYKGLEQKDASARGLRVQAKVRDLHREMQEPSRRIWLGPIRLVREAVHVGWDQRHAPFSFNGEGDLTFRYSLRVTNRLDRPITATLELVPIDVTHATASVSQERLELAAHQTETVTASVTLPAPAVKAGGPLYCERFEVRASAEGIDDSTVSILRSSDPIPLTVTVPIAEERLRFPLLARRKELPASITGQADVAKVKDLAAAASPDDLKAAMNGPLNVGKAYDQGLGYWGRAAQDWNVAGWRFMNGLTACAFLYDSTGEKPYLQKGTAMLLRAAELFPPRQGEWEKAAHAPISHGIIAANTLGLGWATGSMRPPYFYQRHGMFNDFDLLAGDMAPADRKRIIEGFLLPAAIQMRNHYFGLGNQQDVVNYPVLYAGLAARNWPLVSHAYSSPHGLREQLRWDFDDNGLAGEGNYHVPAIRPILWSTELLYQVGVDLYDERLYQITHSEAAKVIGKPFTDPIRAYLDEHRFAGKGFALAESAGGVHLTTGLTALRWNGREIAMNWGMQMNRGAPDRCSLRIKVPQGDPLYGLGGGNYSHSSLGQSIIIIDESRQNPVSAKVTGYDVEGPVQFVQATSSDHYPGTTVTRTFALIGGHVLVIDRITSDKPRTVDWCVRYQGGVQTYEDVAGGVSPKMNHVAGSFTDKPSDQASGVNFGRVLKSEGHFVSATDGPWRQSRGALSMAGGAKTTVHVFAVPAAFSAWVKERQTGVPVLMARRRDVQKTDFIVALSPEVDEIQRLPVKDAQGNPSDAVGIAVKVKSGEMFHVIVNDRPDSGPVTCAGLTTSERFATDWRKR